MLLLNQEMQDNGEYFKKKDSLKTSNLLLPEKGSLHNRSQLNGCSYIC